MADPTDTKRFLRAEEQRRHEAELREQEAELRRRAEHRERQAEHRERQERKRNRQTTFEEFIQHCHDLLSRPLRAEEPSRSTTGKIPTPTGKCVLYDSYLGLIVQPNNKRSTTRSVATFSQ